MAMLSKAWVCGRSLSAIAGIVAGVGVCVSFVLCVVCCQVEVPAASWSLVQRNTTDCGVSESELETSPVRRLWPLGLSSHEYTGCPRRNAPDFGRVFLMLKYTDITQNTYVQS